MVICSVGWNMKKRNHFVLQLFCMGVVARIGYVYITHTVVLPAK